MIDPKQVDFNQLPKKFCDGMLGGFNKDVFFFSATSGNYLENFSTTPRIMKSIAIWANQQIESYEKQFGVIEGFQPIESPIQLTDLK